MSRWPRVPFDSLKHPVVLQESYMHILAYCYYGSPCLSLFHTWRNFLLKTNLASSPWQWIYIWTWLIVSQDSFNKNTSQSTLIIHYPTATGAINGCSSINESIIWSTFLFVNTNCDCSHKAPAQTSSILSYNLTVKVLMHHFQDFCFFVFYDIYFQQQRCILVEQKKVSSMVGFCQCRYLGFGYLTRISLVISQRK